MHSTRIAACYQACCCLLLALLLPAYAAPLSYDINQDVDHPVMARHGMVATVDKTATGVGYAPAVMRWMRRWPWVTPWRSPIRRRAISAAAVLC